MSKESDKNSFDYIRESLHDIRNQMGAIQGVEMDIAEIKKDINHHIERTDLLQKMVEPVYKAYVVWTSLKKSVFVIAALLTGAAAFYSIKSAKAADLTIKSAFSRLQTESKCKLNITSAGRSKAHNKRVGGAPGSYHLKNRAYDLKPVKRSCISLKKLQRLACKYVSTVLYSRHLHIDTRKVPVHLKGWYKWERNKHGTKSRIYHSNYYRTIGCK